jgi:putative spermidine/putrescine transport system permease protein
MSRRLSTFLYERPRLGLSLLLGPPLLAFAAFYFGALGALVLQSFFHLDGFTGQVVRRLTLATYADLFTRANLDIVARSVVMASLVTAAAAVFAFPLAYFMARYASARSRAVLYLAVLLPLWSSYLVRVYSWKLILAKEGILGWVIERVGLAGALESLLALPVIGGPSLSVSPIGTFLAFLYVWLPYMILPVAAALERIPETLLEASGDLGARPWGTFRHVTLPLALPGLAAGSIFTFSLTLGDFVVPGTLGNSALFIGQAVLAHQGTAGNIPLAAAFTAVPMVVMGVYLLSVRRLGAFDAL